MTWRHALRGRSRLLREGLWVGIGQGASAAGLLIGIRLLTELLSPAAYGTLSLLIGVWSFARIVFGVSVLQAGLRYYGELAPAGGMARLRSAVSRLLLRAYLWPVIGILVVGGSWFLVNGESPLPAALLVLLLVADVVRTYEINFLAAARRQRETALIDALEALSRPVLALGAIFFLGASVSVVLTAYLVATGLAILALYTGVEREGAGRAPEQPREDAALGRDLLRFALPLMPMAAVGWVSQQSDRYIIGAIVGPGAVGIYAAIYGLVSQPFLLGQLLLERTLTPPYFMAVSQGDVAKEKAAFRLFLGGTAALCLVGLAGIALFSAPIADVFLAAPYRSSADLMLPIAAGNALLAIQLVFAKRLYAHKRTGLVFVASTLGALISVVVTVPMVYALGVRGAALACPIYYVFQLLLTVMLTRRTSPAESGATAARP